MEIMTVIAMKAQVQRQYMPFHPAQQQRLNFEPELQRSLTLQYKVHTVRG